jgi:hypothetical protein
MWAAVGLALGLLASVLGRSGLALLSWASSYGLAWVAWGCLSSWALGLLALGLLQGVSGYLCFGLSRVMWAAVLGLLWAWLCRFWEDLVLLACLMPGLC